MKTRYFIFALLALLTTSKIAAQAVTTSTVSAAVKTATVVGSDLKHKKYHKAVGTVLKNKTVAAHVKIDKKVQDKILDPSFNLKNVKADVRKNPVGFVEKHEKDFRGLNRPKWLGGHHKKAVAKKTTATKPTAVKKK